MRAPAEFNLHKFITTNASRSNTILGGSATPYLSLDEIVSLSNDPATTAQVFKTLFTSQALSLASDRGSEELRAIIAQTYNKSSNLTADNILVTNATSGANHILYRSLLTAGDHVVVQYPIYGPQIEEPRDIGCEISYLRLDPSKGWSLSLELLKTLIKPGKTKMIILNNPVNPTGTHIETEVQRSIIQIAKEHNIMIHCDEIFRPFFHTAENEIPTSFTEHADLEYDNIATTSSLSKCYGLSGVRIGWISCRSSALYAKFRTHRMFSVQALSLLDETVAMEALGPRCRPGILEKHLNIAKRNLDLIEGFINSHSDQCEWVRPTAGAVAFVKFKDYGTGKPVDDIDFCYRLIAAKKVLLSPASFCFTFAEDGTVHDVQGKGLEEYRGRTRFHFTAPTELVERGLKGLDEFLAEEKKTKLANGVEEVKS